MRPLAPSLSQVGEVLDRLGRLFVEEAADHLPFAGIKNCVQSWLACHCYSLNEFEILFLRWSLLGGARLLRNRLFCRRRQVHAGDGDVVDGDRLKGAIPRITRSPRNLLYEFYRGIVALAQDDVVAVEVWSRHLSNEELRAI